MQLPSHNPAKTVSDALQHVHPTMESVANIELTPPHSPRVETPAYRKAHHFLVVEKDSPCLVCGVRNSTLHDPASNPFQATALESHHAPIERSLLECCDPLKVHKVYPQVYDQPTLETFVDSPQNLIILCDIHHRSTHAGIHHLLYQDFVILPFLKDGYQVVATKEDEQAALARDEQIEQQK